MISVPTQPAPTGRKWIGSGEDAPINDELKDLIPVEEEEDAIALH